MMLRVGDRASYTKTITADDIRAYAELTGDKNPLHLDENYARNTRFGRVIAHGMLTASLISAVIGTKLPGPGAIYLEQRLRFTKPVYPGDTVTAEVEVVEFREEKGVVRLRTDCLNQHGERVIEGEAVLLLR